jgi:hypothetical protein
MLELHEARLRTRPITPSKNIHSEQEVYQLSPPLLLPTAAMLRCATTDTGRHELNLLLSFPSIPIAHRPTNGEIPQVAL